MCKFNCGETSEGENLSCVQPNHFSGNAHHILLETRRKRKLSKEQFLNLTRPECILFLKYEIMLYILIFYVSEVFLHWQRTKKSSAMQCRCGTISLCWEHASQYIIHFLWEPEVDLGGGDCGKLFRAYLTTSWRNRCGDYISQKDQMNCRLDTSLLFF